MRTALALLIVVCITAGCAASTKVMVHQKYLPVEQAKKPNRIIFFVFAATADDIHPSDAISGYYRKRAEDQTDEEIQVGRKLGSILAKELVKEIRKTGLPAEHDEEGSAPGMGDLLIQGEFVSIDPGSRTKRLLIGFGAGAGKLETHVELYQITAEGPRLVGKKLIETRDSKLPGLIVPMTSAALGPALVPVLLGGVITARELLPKTLQAVGKGTAKEIAKVLSKRFAELGWL